MGSRGILRSQAQKIYKENVKKIPKRNRIPFSEFFKKYKETLNKQQIVQENKDFDFGEMANFNDDVILEEEIENTEEK
jgi:hypothetical protein